MYAIEFSDVVVSRGAVEVLHGVSFAVPQGGVTAILGSNGAGKSTCLRTISGLNRASQGEVLLNGEDITRTKAHRIVEMGVAHVPEGRQIFPSMTVGENLDIGAYVSSARTDAQRTRVLELFPALAGRLGERAGVLSGGQQQMLAIGRALMSNPSVILMDEPSLGLAPNIVQGLKDLIRTIADQGITIVLVEQNAALAIAACDTGHVLANGRIVVSGTQVELSDNPAIRDAYLGAH